MKNEYSRTIAYYDSIATEYNSSSSAVVLESQIGEFISKIPRGGNVIDIGCGPGHDTKRFCEEGLYCTGIDGSKEMIKIAKARLLNHDRVSFRVQNVLNINDEHAYHGAWCSSIFVHLNKEDIHLFLLKLKKALKSKGTLGIITTKEQQRIPKENDTRNYTMFGLNELEDYLVKSGFKISNSGIITYGNKERIFLIANT